MSSFQQKGYVRRSAIVVFWKLQFFNFIFKNCAQPLSHLFCTLISENQGLEKLRSILNLRKISGPAELIFFSVHLNFFSVCHLNFFQIYTINLKKSRWQTEKKLRCTEKKFRSAGPEIFLRFETDLNFSRPWFSEIKVQIKWPSDWFWYIHKSSWANNFFGPPGQAVTDSI